MPENTQAGAATAPSPATTYDASSTYDVTLKRVVEWPKDSGFYFYPRDHHLMNGVLCQEIAGDIANAKPVAV